MQVICKLVVRQLTYTPHDGIRIFEVGSECSIDVSVGVKLHVEIGVV